MEKRIFLFRTTFSQALIMKANIKTIFFLLVFSTVSFLQCHGLWCDFLNLPHYLSLKPYDYTLEYDGLRGPVKTVTLYSGYIERNYGKETLVKGDNMLDSIVYSPSKLRKERFGEKFYIFYMGIDRIDCIMHKNWNPGAHEEKKTDFTYIGNDSIVEKCGVQQTEYKLLPNGYRFVYYENIVAQARHFSFQKNGTKGEIEETWSDYGLPSSPFGGFYWIGDKDASLIFDSYGRVTKIMPQRPVERSVAYEIEYDQLGNIIKFTNFEYVRRRNRNGYDYYPAKRETITAQYEYDSNGNWIKLRVNVPKDYNVTSYDVPSYSGTIYYFRDIEYYTDEELAGFNISDQRKAREELLARITESAKSYCKSYAQEKNEQYLDLLAGWRGRYNSWNRSPGNAATLVGFDVVGDIYSFHFSDGSSIDSVKFTHTSDVNASLTAKGHGSPRKVNEYFISEDMRVVLVPRYDITLGPLWYVGLYRDNMKYEFVPDTSKDWKGMFVDKYGYRDDVSEEDLNELWKEELDRQYKSSIRNYRTSCVLMVKIGHWDYLFDIAEHNALLKEKIPEVIINQIPNPYDNGFVSPSIADKSVEKELLEKLNKRKEQEKRQRILDFAYDFQIFNDKIVVPLYRERNSDFIVPDDIKVEKLRSFEINGDKYSFTKKDKTVISEKKFTNSLISDDNTIVIVRRNDYIKGSNVYIIELDGNILKSVNLIPTKELKGFIMPDGSTL